MPSFYTVEFDALPLLRTANVPDDSPADAGRHGHTSRGLEPFHDVRVVRPPEAPPVEPVVRRGPGELVHRALRIPVAGAREPARFRRRGLPGAAEDPPGSDHARDLRALRGPLHGGRAALELPVGG